MPSPKSTTRRARRAFWILLAVAALAMGALSSAWRGTPGPLTGLAVAASGAVVLLALGLACRIMIALDNARRRVDTTGR